MRYELYYWAGIQGRRRVRPTGTRGGRADYVDVAREAGGEGAMLRLLDGEEVEHPPFVPPYLILSGAEHGWQPASARSRLYRTAMLDRLDVGGVRMVRRLDRLAPDLLNTFAAITGKGVGIPS
jgi:hypothetical protein